MTDVKVDPYIDYDAVHDKKDPKFKVGDHMKISKYKNIFIKSYTPSWSENVLVIKKVKNTVNRTKLFGDLNNEERLLEHSMKKSCRKQAKQNSQLNKQSREKMTNCMSNGRATITYSIAGYYERHSITIRQYFPKPYEHSCGDVKVQFDLSNYGKGAELKGATGIDTSMLASETDLADLKTKVDDLD